MKNRIIISINFILSIAIYQNVFSQQWAGSPNVTGTITRSGNIEIDSNGQALTIGTSGYSDKYIQFRKNSTYGVRIGLHAVTATGIGLVQTGGGKGFGIKVNSNSDWVNVSDPEFYIEQNGYIGIGTISPEYKLDVSTSFDGLDGLRINNNNSGANTKSGINIKQGSNDMANIFARRNNNEFVFQNNQTVSTAGFTFLNGSISALRINSNGDIGIGHDSPSNKLDVAGTIRAEEVKVESTPWPDYVFSDTYQLRSLSEVSTYIQKNHHLPDIPTAEEVAENGINLGDMNAKLLEKVEELTLYLIEQNEKIEKQQKEIEILKSKVK